MTYIIVYKIIKSVNFFLDLYFNIVIIYILYLYITNYLLNSFYFILN